MTRDEFKEFMGGKSLPSRMLRWAAVAVGVYAILGFLVAPAVVKWQLAKQLTNQLGREVTIERVSINPFALSVRVGGLLVKEPSSNEASARFDELYINFSSTSIFRRAPVLDEIRLVRPEIRIVRKSDKSYNYSDLIQKFTAQPAPQDTASPAPPRFSLNNIELVDGRIDFDDQPEGKQHTISEIQIGIPFFSSLPYATEIKVKPAFFAKVNGTPFFLKGETKPFKDTRETTFRIEIDALDLPRYAEYSPVPLGFRLQRGTLNALLNLSLTTRDSLLDTLKISGNTALKTVQLADNHGAPLAAFDSLESSARFDLTRQGAEQKMIVSGASATLLGLRVQDAGGHTPLLDAGEIKLSDIGADLASQNLTIGELTVDKTNLQVTRYRDGSFSFKLLTDISSRGTAASDKKPAAGTPWNIAIKHLAVKNTGATFNDLLPATPAKVEMNAIEVEAENLSTAPKEHGSLRMHANLNKQGRLEADGKISLNPPAGELNVALKDVALVPFQPYVEENINIAITQGAVASRGRIVFSMAGSEPLKLAFQGDVSLQNFVSLDKPTDQELLKWKTLTLAGINFDNKPFSLGLKEIALNDFYSRLIVNSDGTINLQTLLQGNGSSAPEGAATASSEPGEQAGAGKPTPVSTVSTAAPSKPGSAASALAKPGSAASALAKPGSAASAPAEATVTKPAVKPDIRIGKILFSRGNVNFSDHFVKPNTSANLTGLAGSISEMTARRAGDVMLTGEVNGIAPIDINGRINPLAEDLFLDISANARDIELSPMSPYTIKYAGYGIEKGKLSMRLKYSLEHRKLSGENGIYLDQLTFGEKVDSPTATKLPVLLAVSLLKDRNGVIDVKLPISGSLDDPKFSVGRIILQVLVNLITKAVTSPFALLGAAFGGGEELQSVDFSPGRATLTPEAENKLKTLAKALGDRPGLKMDISGRADPQADRDQIKRFSIERKVKAQKLKAIAESGTPASSDDIVVQPDEYEQYLIEAYKAEKFSKPRNFIGFAKSLPVPEMEQLMFINAQVTEENLRLLANQRAQVVKDWLVKSGQVPPERLFLTAPRIGTENMKDKGSPMRAEFALK